MKEINTIINLIKKTFKHTSAIYMFPFTLVFLVLSFVYLLIGCVFMLIDIFVQELRFELDRGNESAGPLAVGFKYLIVYSVYVSFMIEKVAIKVVMAIIYFLAYPFAFVASLGRLGEGPFAFHKDY